MSNSLSEEDWEHVGYIVDDQGNDTRIPVYARKIPRTPTTFGGGEVSLHMVSRNGAIDITTESFNIGGWVAEQQPFTRLSTGYTINVRAEVDAEQMARLMEALADVQHYSINPPSKKRGGPRDR